MNRVRGKRTTGQRLGRRGSARAPEPVDTETLLDQSWELYEKDQYNEAYAKLEEIPPTERDGKAYLLLMTIVCGDANKNRRMLAVARQLVQTDPTVDYHWGLLGEAAGRIGGVRAAVRVCCEAIRKSPLLASMRCRLAAHYCSLGRLRAAREQLKIALHLEPELIRCVMDCPDFAPIWETIAEAGPPPPEEGEAWKGGE